MRTRLAAFFLLACAAILPAEAQEGPPPDPLEPLQAELLRQDQLSEQGKPDLLISEARKRVSDGTAESWYLLGRALGNVALVRKRENRAQDAEKLLEEARLAFLKSVEMGGLLYAPAHLGLARVARYRDDLDGAVSELLQALRISRGFKAASLELAQVYWEQGLATKAEYVLYQLLEQRPGDSDTRTLLGVLKMQRKRWAEAEPEFRAVLAQDSGNAGVRKLLAAVLMYQEKFADSAEQWEMLRTVTPQDEEPYLALYHVYRRLNKRDSAVAVLQALTRTLPGTEAARRGDALLAELEADPRAWDEPERPTAEQLVKRLDSPDPAVVARTLQQMQDYEWRALPATVYRLLARDAGSAEARIGAVRLVAAHRDPRTLPILEILLFHPKEREPEPVVRREVARAVANLPCPGVVLVLYRALDDADPEIREWAVQGIATQTGKWFRPLLDERTDPKDWAQELAAYRNWWRTSSAALAKEKAAKDLGELFSHIQKGRRRLAEYALLAMDDERENTWRAGYDLFRALAFHTFGAETSGTTPEVRRRITSEAREWFRANGDG